MLQAKRMTPRFWAAPIAALFGCSGGAADSESGQSRGAPPSVNAAGSTGIQGERPAEGGTGGAPPERENEARYLAPVTTGKYLWAANPLSGRVALIDATTLSVRLETAGNGPRLVAGLPERSGSFGALVLNERSHDATLLRVSDDGSISKLPFLPVHPEANALAVSPSGNFAIAWTDAVLRQDPDPLETFQDITLLSLEPGEELSWRMGIGPRPSSFAFSQAEDFVYAVTEEGFSVISLTGEPKVSDHLPFDEDSTASPARRDLSFAPDATYAVVRTEGRSQVSIVALPAGTRRVLNLEGVVTDLDLSPAGDRAYAVLGAESLVIQIPLDRATDPESFVRLRLPDQKFGAIALNPDASAAVLYSTVVSAQRVSLLDDESFSDPERIRHYDLIAPINAVFPSPNPAFAVAFQGPAPGSRKAGAFSVLLLQAPRAPRIEATDASPAQIAFSPDGAKAIVTVRSDAQKVFGAYLVDLPSQQTDFIGLASPPMAAGVISAASRVYVAQSHPEGRITFVSTEDRSVQTVTGFELSARIRR